MKKLVAISLPIALCFALSGCTGLSSAAQNSVYDNDALIAQEADTYSAVDWRGTLPDKLHFGELTGSASLLRLSVPEGGGDFSIDYDATVTAGDFKLVLANANAGSVELVCEGTGTGSRTFSLDKGEYTLKAVGKRAGADLTLQLRASDAIAAVVPDGVFDENTPLELDLLKS